MSDSTLDCLFQQTDERPALISAMHSLSRGDLARIGRQIDQLLATAPAQRGDRVALVYPAGLDAAVVSLAVARRRECAPLNPAYTVAECERLLRGMRIVQLVLPQNAAEDSAAAEAAARLGIPVLAMPPLSVLRARAEQTATPDSAEFPGVLEASPTEIALVLHTSGSTGEPGVVPLTHAQLIASARNVARSLDLGPTDRCLHMLPNFHIGAFVDLLLAPLLSGGSVAVLDTIDGDALLDGLARYRPGWWQAAPAILAAVLRAAERRNQAINLREYGLRLIRSVSAPLDSGLQATVEERFGVPVVEIYGMTETAGLITSNPLPPAERRRGSVGLAAGPELKIVGAQGRTVAAGEIGEVLVRGATVFRGYDRLEPGGADANRPARTSTHSPAGWFHTGDAGYLDEDRYLWLTGRVKEMINRGGEKIAPREIDEALQAHPSVQEAAAFAIPHATLGETVAVALVPAPEQRCENAGRPSRPDNGELERWLGARLSEYKLPRAWHWLDELPRAPGGKLQRHRLAAICARTATEPESSPAATGENAAPLVGDPAATPTESLLAELWRHCLQLEPTIAIQTRSDFFELGGDSLSAAEFIRLLQRRLDRPVPLTVLLDYPVFGDLAEYLAGVASPPVASAQPAADRAAQPQPPPLPEQPAPATPLPVAAALPERTERELRGYLGGWQGERPLPDGLLVARNVGGARPPLFFGFQGYGEFDQLASALGADQPLYAMRSLTDVHGKGPANNERLASLYLAEIKRVQPRGPYLLGGWCEAGKIAFWIAEALRAAGHPVAALVLQDSFVARSYDGPLALFYSRPGMFFHEPDATTTRYYTGACEVYPWAGPHLRYYSEDGMPAFAERLADVLDRAMRGRLRRPELPAAYPPMAPEACRASLRGRFPLFMDWGEQRRIAVQVRNRSEREWPPHRISQLILSSRWLNVAHSQVGRVDARAAIEQSLPPGARLTLPLNISVGPRHRAFSIRILDIDVVEEGALLFQQAGSRSLRFTVISFRGARFFRYVFPLHLFANPHRLFAALGIHWLIEVVLRRQRLRRG